MFEARNIMPWLLLTALLAGCAAVGDLDEEDGGFRVVSGEDGGTSVPRDVGRPVDMSGELDAASTDAGTDAGDASSDDVGANSDASADMAVEPDAGPCPQGCAPGEVCRAGLCADICATNGAVCGTTELDGVSASCGTCPGNELCLDNTCLDACAESNSDCGTVDWFADNQNCGTCSSASCWKNQCVIGTWRTTAAGFRHSCALRSTGEVECWGEGGNGQLGDNSRTDRTAPVTATGLFGITQLASLSNHTCALKPGEIRCWGPNDFGQIGDGSTGGDELTPSIVSGQSNAIEVAVGNAHTCSRRANGSVSCWGYNNYGQVGIGVVATTEPLPRNVSGISDAVSIAAGGFHTCIARRSGVVSCWGSDLRGQVTGPGDGTSTPRDVAGVSGARRVTAGADHTCALNSAGDVYCWGAGSEGQLGNDLSFDRDTPVQALVSNVVRLAAGKSHTCAVDSNDELWCWGANANGQLGVGDTASRARPTKVALADVLDVSCGTTHTCATTRGGTLWCWGANDSAQLQGTTTTNVTTPKSL